MLNTGGLKKIAAVIIVLILILVLNILYFVPKISVRNVEQGIHGVTDKTYDLGYNLYGEVIFKNQSKALKNFKKDYAEGLKYLEDNGFPEFSTKYETLVKYGVYSWQTYIDDNVENKEELQHQLSVISVFAYTYWSGNWQHYFPMYKCIS